MKLYWSNEVEQPFMCMLTVFISLDKCLFKSLDNFFNWVICLFIIKVKEFFTYPGSKPLVSIWFLNIVSHSVRYLFTFSMASIAAQVLNSDEVQLNFSFVTYKVIKIYTCVSSESFILSAFTFRSLIHFQFIFIFIIK